MKMPIVLITLFITVCFQALASITRDVNTSCKNQVEDKLRYFKSKDLWIPIVVPKPGHKMYRSATQTLGHWLEIILSDKPVVSYITPRGTYEYSWETSNCNHQSFKFYEPSPDHIDVDGYSFKDKDLKELLDSNGSYLIYVYSPRMTYSIKEMQSLAEAAEELGFNFVPIIDPTVQNFRENDHPYLKGKTIIKAASIELLMRQMFVHFPTSLVVYKGKILDPFIFGVMSQENFQREIKRRVSFYEENL